MSAYADEIIIVRWSLHMSDKQIENVSNGLKAGVIIRKVTDKLTGDRYMVELDGGGFISAHISGRLRMNHISINPENRVEVEISDFDLTGEGLSDAYENAEK